MSKSANTEKQLADAIEFMDSHREALSALAKPETVALDDMTPEMRRQMEIAKERTKKYRTAYSRSAK